MTRATWIVLASILTMWASIDLLLFFIHPTFGFAVLVVLNIIGGGFALTAADKLEDNN